MHKEKMITKDANKLNIDFKRATVFLIIFLGFVFSLSLQTINVYAQTQQACTTSQDCWDSGLNTYSCCNSNTSACHATYGIPLGTCTNICSGFGPVSNDPHCMFCNENKECVNPTCSASPNPATTIQSVVWNAGDVLNSCSVVWSGDDSLSGQGINLTHIYGFPSPSGGYNANITVACPAYTSQTRSCIPLTVTEAPLVGSCSASPARYVGGSSDTLNWIATASGGTGAYQYEWFSNSDYNSGFLSIGSSISITGPAYPLVTAAETHTVYLKIISGSKELKTSCSVNVVPPEFKAFCSSDPPYPTLSNGRAAVEWRGTVLSGPSGSGNSSNYSFNWTIDGNSIADKSSTISSTYSAVGSHSASLYVTDSTVPGQQSNTVTCNLDVTALPAGRCFSNTDCSGTTPVCDLRPSFTNANGVTQSNPNQNKCVQCSTGATAACTGQTPICNTDIDQCVQCTSNSQCTAPATCQSNVCTGTGGAGDVCPQQCPQNQTCSASTNFKCVPITPGSTCTNGICEIKSPLGDTIKTIPDAIAKILGLLVKIMMPIIVIFFIIAGLMFIMARGNAAKLETAKKTLLYTTIGAAVVLGAWVFAQAIEQTIKALK